MNKYLAVVRVNGQTVRTMVYAESSLHARLFLEFQFGMGNVVVSQTAIVSNLESSTAVLEILKTIKPIKPMSPQQVRIDSLKKQKDTATKNLQAERNRQKVASVQPKIGT
jgi:hypothetical protein